MSSTNLSVSIKTNQTKEKSNMTYKIDIADRTGHTTVADLELDAAVDTICDNAEKNQRWVFINGEKFEFEGADVRDNANVNKLRNKLAAENDPMILLTGVLVGGTAQEAYDFYTALYKL